MLPLLITGITGVAGCNAFHYFSKRHPGQVVGIRPRKAGHQSRHGIVGLDVDDRPAMAELFQTHRFHSVLNCVGNCALKSCELDPEMAQLLNVVSADVIADNVLAHCCRLVHLSSDLVYSGKGTGNYIETDPTDPVTVYGKSMVQAEEAAGGQGAGGGYLADLATDGAERQ